MRHLLLLPVVLILLLSTAGCESSRHNSRLEEIAGIVADSPLVAKARLDSINPARLSERDRHYYDLLTVKARDKAFITHTSDSLTLDVIDYYSSHRSSGLYPEALYYGGRVYYDLGDYPTALHYFQEALDGVPDDAEHLRLKGCITTQTASILNQLRIYSQAIPYLEESIVIDSLVNDTYGLADDHRLLGAVYLHQKEYDLAEKHFEKAFSLSQNLSTENNALMKAYLAAIQYKKGDNDAALTLMRGLPEICNPRDNRTVLAYAARIYLKAGVLDTAYMYAHRLAYMSSSRNQKTGYQLLLSPELSAMVPTDSLQKFVKGYRRCMEDYFNENDATATSIQISYYNYTKHLQEKETARKAKERTQFALVLSLLLIAALCVVVLSLRYRNTKQTLRLRETLDLVSSISAELSKTQSEIAILDKKPSPAASIDELRQQLLDRMTAIEQSGTTIPISETILTSDLYKTLISRIEHKMSIPDSSPLWRKIEELILSTSPDFVTNLQKLTNGHLSKADLEISLLVRLGISPSGMSALLSLAPGSVSSRRSALGKKIFGKNFSTKAIDAIIRLL